MPQRLADPLAQSVVALDLPLDRPELRNRESLLRSGLLDRQVVVFLHRLVNADVLIDLAGRDIFVVLVSFFGRRRRRSRLGRELKSMLMELRSNSARAGGRSDWRRPCERSRKYSPENYYECGRRACALDRQSLDDLIHV